MKPWPFTNDQEKRRDDPILWYWGGGTVISSVLQGSLGRLVIDRWWIDGERFAGKFEGVAGRTVY